MVWEPLSTVSVAPVPLPARLGILPEFGVIGRAVEATTIAEALKRVEAGAGREILLVSGEAGQGKTTLVAEAARRAFEEGACVLFGHSEEDVARPYQLFVEALSHYVSHAPEDLLLDQMGDQAIRVGRAHYRHSPPGYPDYLRQRPPTRTPSAI